MALNNSKLLSGRAPVTPYSNLSSDRYQFLGLSEAEPSLGAGANNSVLTISTSNTRVWSNALSISSLTVNGVSNLGNVGNVIITGGTNGFYLQTDGSGNLTWASVPTGTGISNGNSSVNIPVASGNVVTTANGNIILTITETGANVAGTLDVTGVSNLGPIANVRITGGTSGQIVQTDGNGNLIFIDPAVADSAAPMPYLIPVGDTYYVPNNFQGLFTVPITIDGTFEIDGILAEVGTAINSENSQIIFDDNGELTGNTGFTFDQTSGNLAVPGAGIFTGALLPSANITYDLGSNTQRWRDLYLANNSIFIGTSTINTDGPNLVFTNGDGGEFQLVGNSISTTYSLSNGTSNLTVNTSTINLSANGNANVLVISNYGINIAGTLSATGNAAVSGILTDNIYYANGSPYAFTTSAAGSNTQIQFNNNGVFSASANLTFDSATNNLAVTGNISATNLAVTGNAVVTGNLYVDGNLIYINVEELSVQDPIITLNTGPNGVPPVANTGKDVGTALFYYDTQARTAFMGWDTSNSEFAFGSQTSISSEVVTFTTLGNVRAQTFLGNVVATTISGDLTTASQSNITTVGTLGNLSVSGNITSGNVIGGNIVTANYLVSSSGCVTIGGATIAVSGNNAGIFASLVDDINLGIASNIVMGGASQTVTIQGNLIANNNVSVTGNVSGNLLIGTLTTNSQPNITSVGTLGNLSVSGNVNSGNITVTNTIDAVNIKVTDLYSKRPAIAITSNTMIDTFPTTQFRSAKYTMRAGDGTDYQALEVLLVHNDINSIITVYGSLSTSGTDLVIFSTDISAGNVNVYATAVGANTNLNLMGTYVPD